MATIMAVSNETNSSLSRMTKEGRRLTYELVIIQQPERARACGSGAKSSADRRPVDPPPVVQLKILEGEAKNDITFSYNANFFLFITLEHARPMAQGRVPPSAPTLIPVLTGTPVAGMAYLDRPDLAGYFVFPDLSVRHEGKYRLSFNLYEELKDPKDADAEPAAKSPVGADTKHGPKAPQTHVHFRLEVKSVPFNVYSAKKFPGLAESTSISRIVAEQGCRVRIRRDVRMRRRDVKPGKNGDEWDHEQTYSQAFQHSTRPQSSNSIYNSSQQPLPPVALPQSANAGYPFQQLSQRPPKLQIESSSNFSYQQPPQSTPRRESGNTYTSFQHPSLSVPRSESTIPGYSFQQVSQPAPRPESANSCYSSFQQPSQLVQQPQSANSCTSHLSFGGSRTSNYQNSVFQPPAAPASQFTQHCVQKEDAIKYSATMHSQQISNPQSGGYTQAPPAQSNPQNGGYSQAQTSQLTYQTQQPQISNPPNGNYRPISAAIPAYDGTATKYTYATTPRSANSGAAIATKRPFGAVFDSDHINQPMHGGMRPTSDGQAAPQIEAEDGTLWEEYATEGLKELTYKRADGSRTMKKLPTLP